MKATAPTWHQMVLESPEGRKEVLWVEECDAGRFRVLSVPVWCYGLSIGSVVEAKRTREAWLEFTRVVHESRGGTLRAISSRERTAREVYVDRIVPDAKRLGLVVGPATFFASHLIALHLRYRDAWWPQVGAYLDALVSEGILEQWEVADPDRYAADHPDAKRADVLPPPLVHPMPVDGAESLTLS